MKPETLLLTGATGFLGRRLAPELAVSWRVLRASRSAEGEDSIRLDLEDADSVRRAFDRVRPSVVVHCGAVAGPDECEREPERARRVNLDAARVIAQLCGGAKARLVHLSTDLVFDGEKGWYSEDDAPNPISVYGRAKLEAEEAVLTAAPGACALRVASVYGRPLGTRTCFVDELRAALSQGRPIGAFTDQWRTPTAGDRLGEVILRLLADPDLDGVYHWGGADRVTRHESALRLCRAFGYDETLVRPTRASDARPPAPRPRDSSLDSSRLAAALGLAPTPLDEGFAALKAAL
ncbi:MAG: SDR family oxidoreductase [Elusimicrobia bacterium]|nr:SDR family oxidoreductase [Elusimicrobiota bacterium]